MEVQFSRTKNSQNWQENNPLFSSNEVLHISSGIEEVGGVQTDLFCFLLLAWVIVYGVIWKGLHNSGKVTTASAPPHLAGNLHYTVPSTPTLALTGDCSTQINSRRGWLCLKVNVEILYLNKIHLKIENYEENTVRINIMQAIKIDSFSTQIRYILHTLLYQSSPPKSLKIFRRMSECWREAKIKIQLSHAVKLDGSNNWTLFYFPNVYLGGGIYLQLRVGNWFAHFCLAKSTILQRTGNIFEMTSAVCLCGGNFFILTRENINELWEIFLSVLSMISKASTMVLCCHYPLINGNNNLHIFGALF